MSGEDERRVIVGLAVAAVNMAVMHSAVLARQNSGAGKFVWVGCSVDTLY